MDEIASREMFALSNIHPDWPSARVVGMEQSLRDGLVRLQKILDGADAALIAIHTEFDYDGMYERIETIESIRGDDTAVRAAAMLAAYLSEISAKHPTLLLTSKQVLPMNVLPATGSIVPGTFPPQFGGFRLANDALYEAIYLRVHIIEKTKDTGSIFEEILGIDGIRDSLIDYIYRLGGKTNFSI